MELTIILEAAATAEAMMKGNDWNLLEYEEKPKKMTMTQFQENEERKKNAQIFSFSECQLNFMGSILSVQKTAFIYIYIYIRWKTATVSLWIFIG